MNDKKELHLNPENTQTRSLKVLSVKAAPGKIVFEVQIDDDVLLLSKEEFKLRYKIDYCRYLASITVF